MCLFSPASGVFAAEGCSALTLVCILNQGTMRPNPLYLFVLIILLIQTQRPLSSKSQFVISYPPHLAPRKPSKVRKKYPPITFMGYSRVHEEVRSYTSSFLIYESITNFLNFVKLCCVDRPDVMIIKSCLESECILNTLFSGETHFMYMQLNLFLNLHLTVSFDKFEVNVLRELNVSLTLLHLN